MLLHLKTCFKIGTGMQLKGGPATETIVFNAPGSSDTGHLMPKGSLSLPKQIDSGKTSKRWGISDPKNYVAEFCVLN